jgi:hypothetical protein
MATFTGLLTGAPMTYVAGQIVLGLSVYVSFFFLADRPLINPIQAVVVIFYWWFGVGPAVISTWNALIGMSDAALEAQITGMESLWVVASGLILYSIVSRLTLKWFFRLGFYARFLRPSGDNYNLRTLLSCLLMIGFSSIVLIYLKYIGIQGQEEVSFLGGTKTTIWWVGVIVAIGSIAPFITSSLMTALASPWKKIPIFIKVLICFIIVQTTINALFGGWKTPIAFMGALYVCAYVSRYQRVPWVMITIGMIVFLGFITPFVMYARSVAISSGADNSKMRNQIFSNVLKDPDSFLLTSIKNVDISILFRGIYPLAGVLTQRNSFFHGEWDGYTIPWGFELPVPRVFCPNKRDENIGNFFSRTVGADIGATKRDDMLTNLAVSIPFEFVGNYGIAAGISSFGFIGFFWSLFVGWMLSPARLANHPLAPLMTMSAMALESPFGHYLVWLRGFIIPLCIFYSINKISKLVRDPAY